MTEKVARARDVIHVQVWQRIGLEAHRIERAQRWSLNALFGGNDEVV
jgi:hypothetical protein